MRRITIEREILPSRRTLVAVALFSLALVAVAATPQLLGRQVGRSFDGLEAAQPAWLWLAATLFVGALLANAFAWRAALRSVGACELTRADSAARYCTGSLVNSLMPARIGDAVRLALYARTLPTRDRLWTTGGVFAAIGAARLLVLGVMVAIGAAIGALPLWPLALAGALVGGGALLAYGSRGRALTGRAAHLLDAFRALGRRPGRAAWIIAWLTVATAARVGGASAIVAALGVHAPFEAAIIVVAALDLAGILPLTPGNVGITSGAVMVALQARGVGMTSALTTGIAMHAVETAAGIGCGSAGALLLARFSSPRVRRWSLVAAGAAASLALGMAFSATVLAPLV